MSVQIRAESNGRAAFAKRLDATVAMIDKSRTGPNVAKAMNVVGEVEGKVAIILDDMIDTAGTLTEAAACSSREGCATSLCCGHSRSLSGPAVERILGSQIEKVIVTDTIPLPEEVANNRKICAALGRGSARGSHLPDS